MQEEKKEMSIKLQKKEVTRLKELMSFLKLDDISTFLGYLINEKYQNLGLGTDVTKVTPNRYLDLLCEDWNTAVKKNPTINFLGDMFDKEFYDYYRQKMGHAPPKWDEFQQFRQKWDLAPIKT
ncbi:MAG: hypothetical protein ACFFCZ_28175 [Promethearchaeota archaeon]